MNKSLIESMRNIFENDNEKNITIPDIDQKYKDMIHKFIDFTNQFLELKTLPDIEFVQERGDIPMTTGSYIPDQNKLYILIRNRAICDYLRTLAHELVHYKQQEDGKIPDNLQGMKS